MKKAIAALVFVLAALGAAQAGDVRYWDRDGVLQGTFVDASWAQLQTAITTAQTGGSLPTDIGEVRISGNIDRDSGETQLTINDGYVRISGGWDAAFVTQSGRSTLDVDETGGAGDQRGFLITTATNVTLDSIYLTDHEAQDDPTPGSSFDAKAGSGIYASAADFLVLTNVVIHSGVVDYTNASDGSGIYCRNTAGLRMSDCQFIANYNPGSASNGQGGPISLDNVGTAAHPAIIERTVIRNNSTPGGVAGAIYHRGGGVLYVVNSHIYRNEAPFTVRAGGSSTRVVLFGCLIEGNTENDASVANFIYPVYSNQGGGVDSGNGYITLANCTIASNRTSAAGAPAPWGRIAGGAANNGVAFQDSLNMINTIVARDHGCYTFYESGEYAYADLQACTFDGDTTNFLAEHANGAYTVWGNVVEAMTQPDDDGRYRFNNRNDATGVREDTTSGSNWQADPGLIGTGAAPYALWSVRDPGATPYAVDRGVLRRSGSFKYVDIDHDGAFTANIDIVVAGSGYPAESLFVYTKDMAGNPRVQGGKIDRGYFETAAMTPTVIIVR